MKIWKCIYRSIRNFLFFFFIVVLLPGIPPKTTFDIEPFSIPTARELTGPLAINSYLDKAERLLEGRVYGPEALLVRGNEIYTSVHGGEVIKIKGTHITHVAKFGKPCEMPTEEAKCGRPLGIAFDTVTDGLIVSDAYYGIWHVDINNGKKTQLISPEKDLPGEVTRKAKIFNGVVVGKDGTIYWTDSSSDYTIADGVCTLFTNPSGRLFSFDRVRGGHKVLLDRLHFANGLALSPNEEFLIVSETASGTIRRYYLKGPLAGKSDVFVDGLPGGPDNLVGDSNGIWVALATSCDSSHPCIWHSAANAPLIRKFILRCLFLIELPFKLINDAFPNIYTKSIIRFIGHFESVRSFAPKRTTVIRLDWNGNIVGSLHGHDQSVSFISHALEYNDYLYLGSYANQFIGRVKLPEEFRKISAGSKTTTTTTTTTARPTTTTTTTTRPPTTTTTPRPTTTTTTTTTPPPTTTTQRPTTLPPTPKTTDEKVKTKPKEEPTVVNPKAPAEPAPIHEHVPKDTKKPEPEKLKVIKRGGDQGEF